MPRAPKKCGRPNCTTRVVGRTYCTPHQAERQARANTTQRGYGYEHQLARAHALAALTPDQLCPHCHQPMSHDQDLDLDHTDDRRSYRGLAHRTCNARAGALAKTQAGNPSPPPNC